MGAGDVSLGPTALSSSYQLVANLLPALSVTGTCWVMNNWDDEAASTSVERLGTTVLAANAPVLAAALDESRHRDGVLPASLRLVLSGEDPLPADLKRAWGEELAVPLAEIPAPDTSPVVSARPVSGAPGPNTTTADFVGGARRLSRRLCQR